MQYNPPAGHSYTDVSEAPPPSYDSHYASASSSSSSAASPPKLPARPDKFLQTDSLGKDNGYSQPSPASPVGSIIPFPHPSITPTGSSTLLQAPSSDLSRSSAFAQSRGDHPPPSPVASSSSSVPSQIAPPSFHRPPPIDLPYSNFPPIALYTTDNSLNGGFPRKAPGTIVQPHPFATHDVRQEDWLWFLSQVKGAANAAGMDFTSIPGVTPVATHLAVSVGK